MKKLILLLTITTILFSCSNSGNANSNSLPTNLPIGTIVKLEASISSGTTIPDIGYKDGQGNQISLSNVPNNWSITYEITTTPSIPNVYLSLNSAESNISVTGKIYINGVLTKNATGNPTVTLYCP